MDRLSDEQVAELRSLSLKETLDYWDALEAAGKAPSGKINKAVRVLVRSDLY